MRKYKLVSCIGVAAALAIFLGPAEAPAQWNNSPYQPKFRGLPGGAGMSPGYRQVIISRELGDRQRYNFYRGASGELVEITRKGRNAFTVSPEGFPSSRNRLARTGFGYGASGSGRATYSVPLDGSANAVIGGWIRIVEGDAAYRVASVSVSATPIDSWISQLAAFEKH